MTIRTVTDRGATLDAGVARSSCSHRVRCRTRAFAHSENGVAIDFWGGFTHPIFGPDHVVAMVAVGLWGAFLGPPAIWVLPVVFPLVMAVGGRARRCSACRCLASKPGSPSRPSRLARWWRSPQSRRYGSPRCWSVLSRSSTAMPMAPSFRSARTRSPFPWASSSPPACCTSAASHSGGCPIGRPAGSPCGRRAASLPLIGLGYLAHSYEQASPRVLPVLACSRSRRRHWRIRRSWASAACSAASCTRC